MAVFKASDSELSVSGTLSAPKLKKLGAAGKLCRAIYQCFDQKGTRGSLSVEVDRHRSREAVWGPFSHYTAQESVLFGKQSRPQNPIRVAIDNAVYTPRTPEGGTNMEAYTGSQILGSNPAWLPPARVSNFVEEVNSTIKSKWNSRLTTTHHTVSVLLLSWPECDTQLHESISNLGRIFQESYGFAIEEWKLPTGSNRYIELLKKVDSFVDTYGGDENLLVIYYGGHARHQPGNDPIWVSSNHNDAKCVESSAIFPILAAAQSDVLLLLDATEAMPDPFDSETTGIVSAISLSSVGLFDTLPETSPGILARCLSHELQVLSRSTASVSDVILHSRLLEILSNAAAEGLAKLTSRLEMMDVDRGRTHESTTLPPQPIYRHLSSNRLPRPIYLGSPLTRDKGKGIENIYPGTSRQDQPSTHDATDSTTATITIDARLDPDMIKDLSTDEWSQWLLKAPIGIKGMGLNLQSGEKSSHVPIAELPTTFCIPELATPCYIPELPVPSDIPEPFSFIKDQLPLMVDQNLLHTGLDSQSLTESVSPDSSPTAEYFQDDTCPYPGCTFTPQGKRENFGAYLRKHSLSHNRTASFKCQLCDKTFTRRDNLRVHARRAHARRAHARRAHARRAHARRAHARRAHANENMI